MATEQRGPFDRLLTGDEPGAAVPDRAALYVGGTIIGLAILLLILVLPPISILSGDDGDAADLSSGPETSDSYTSKVRRNMPKLPPGLTAASVMFDLGAPEDRRGASGVTVKLKEKQSDARPLGLYTYSDDHWVRLGDVTLIEGGAAARGEVQQLPGNVAVLKRNRAALQVAALLPAGTTLHEDAGPVLTMLHPLVFIPTAAGDVAGAPPAVPPGAYRVIPAIVSPDAEVIDAVLRSEDIRTRHADSIVGAISGGNFAGVNVDYRGVNPTLRSQFTAFIEDLAQKLEGDGRTLVLTLPMPDRTTGQVEEGAYDWERLGAAADLIELAAEADQELYFQTTEAALDAITQRIDRTKVLLTIPSLSMERGGEGYRPLPLTDALAIASTIAVRNEQEAVAGGAVELVAPNIATSEGASGIAWSDAARAVTFSYPGAGGERTVWIANAFSIAFRLELAQRFGLGGVVITDGSQVVGGGWAPIRELADTGTLTLSKPNPDMFVPTWSTADGSLSSTIGDAVVWTAPAESGTYDVSLTVSDGVVRAVQSASVQVGAAEAPP